MTTSNAIWWPFVIVMIIGIVVTFAYRGQVRRRWFVSRAMMTVPVLGSVVSAVGILTSTEAVFAGGLLLLFLFGLASIVYSQAERAGRVVDDRTGN